RLEQDESKESRRTTTTTTVLVNGARTSNGYMSDENTNDALQLREKKSPTRRKTGFNLFGKTIAPPLSTTTAATAMAMRIEPTNSMHHYEIDQSLASAMTTMTTTTMATTATTTTTATTATTTDVNTSMVNVQNNETDRPLYVPQGKANGNIAGDNENGGESDNANVIYLRPNDNCQVRCRNWFFKISAIRELLPRLLVELSLFRCTRFVYSIEDIFQYMGWLVQRLNGVSDPLAAAYLKAFAAKQIFQVFGNFHFSPSVCPNASANANASDETNNHSLNVINQVYLQLLRHTLQMLEHMNESMYRGIDVITQGLMYSEDYLNLFRPMLDITLSCIAWKQPFSTLADFQKFIQLHIQSKLLEQIDLQTFLTRLQNSNDSNFLFCLQSHPSKLQSPNQTQNQSQGQSALVMQDFNLDLDTGPDPDHNLDALNQPQIIQHN
ncbi:hypothetical protein RFI_09189, partial [Reticulomyxa filosa]